MLADKIRYFRDCYEQDNSRSAIWNIFSTSIEHRIPIEGKEELLAGGLPWTPIPRRQGMEAKQAAHIYSKEKDLIYASLCIVDSLQQGDQRPQTLCAPILWHPATIVDHESYTYLDVDLDNRQVNHRLLDVLQDSDEQERLSDRARVGRSPYLVWSYHQHRGTPG